MGLEGFSRICKRSLTIFTRDNYMYYKVDSNIYYYLTVAVAVYIYMYGWFPNSFAGTAAICLTETTKQPLV